MKAVRKYLRLLITLLSFLSLFLYFRQIQAGEWIQHTGSLWRWKQYFDMNPILLVLLFVMTHIFVSFCCIPGCSILNIFSGYTFGFWKGSLIVYLATLMSATLGFIAGRYFTKKLIRLNDILWVLDFKSRLKHEGLYFLASLRLNPFLPFGLLNLVMGITDVNATRFFISTVAGVFFDVTVLNRVGYHLRESQLNGLSSKEIAGFTITLGLFLALLLYKWNVRLSPIEQNT